MRRIWTILFAAVPLALFAAICNLSFGVDEAGPKEFKVHPIGYVKVEGDRTYIVLDKKYESGLLRMNTLSEIWVLWWFDRNDTPEKRSILQVHPQGNPKNPLTGVFATHSPVRPNLIAMTRCKIISVKENVIEIEGIDAFPGTPVLDIKS
jgi:tRNA-Thr(GGU) m(6)t(6)A37 methyltransferase TsaA